MTEVLIRLRPLPGSAWIKQDHTFSRSEISFADEAVKYPRGALAVVSVRLNGTELPHRVASPTSIEVTPLVRLEGDRLDILCSLSSSQTEEGPSRPLRVQSYSQPAPDHGYGLQRATNLPTRHPQ